jgi:hypothetical protein
MVMTLRIWQHYLLRNVVYIYTDHKSLKYIFNQPNTEHKSLKYIFTQLDPNMRQRRCLELFKEYELEVHYHPRKTNAVADALSRKAHYNYLPAMRSMGEECNTRVLPDLSLFNIILTPTLKGEIIAA